MTDHIRSGAAWPWKPFLAGGLFVVALQRIFSNSLIEAIVDLAIIIVLVVWESKTAR